MNIDYLIQLLNNRLNALALAKDQAFMAGDLERINAVDAEISGVNDTLYKLNLLASVSAVASATGTTEATVVSNGIGMVIDSGALLEEAVKCLERYDITPYATDPLHEEKVAMILRKMPLVLDTPVKVDEYIQQTAPGSPITGVMVLAATQIYAVDVRLTLALMQQDSQFGTQGLAVQTLNPGNVGNTGTETRTYASWAEGVTAVAEWLSRHHKVVIAVEEIKGNIQFDTVPTSTLAVPPVVTSSTLSDTVTPPPDLPVTEPIPTPPVAPTSTEQSAPPVSPPETSSPTSSLEQLIENIISPPDPVTSTEPVANVVEAVTSTVEEVVPTPASTVEEVIDVITSSTESGT